MNIIHAQINKCMNDKKVSIQNKLLSYSTGVRGHWVFKASTWNEIYIMLIGFNKLNGHYFTRMFTSYEEATEYIEFLTFSQFHTPDLPQWNQKTEDTMPKND